MKFIPHLHFEKPENKLSDAWCSEVINYYWHNYYNKGLLDGKDIKEIDSYRNGNFDMTPFKRIFKSMKKAMDKARQIPNMSVSDIDTVGLDWTPLPLIPMKVNSAVSLIQKIPVEVKVTATDALAVRKKQEDIAFLKNKPIVEDDLQELADQMQLGPVDLGTTNHSAEALSDTPYGLDLNEPDELDVFVNILYSLKAEAAYETILQIFYELKNASGIKLLECEDQFKYGVSVNQAHVSSITGLPDCEYVHPVDVMTPPSKYKDFRDNTHRFVSKTITALEMFNYFSDEIGEESNLDKILNDKDGYCACNNVAAQDAVNWGTFKVELVYVEVKSVDWIGVVNKPKSKYRYFTSDENEATEKLWGQNTYCFWWLKNTKYFFKKGRLSFAYRKRGLESYQNFSTNIYKTQEKSAVELAIGENKKAQIADIKLQHAIIKSLPAGKYIDLRFLRGALTGLKDEDNQYTIDDLVNLAFEHNIVIGDTERFDRQHDAQFVPLKEINGGMRTEIEGYMTVIARAERNISAFTGINEQLTGQSANPEGLVGMQKLLINSSINALYYANEAIREQIQNLFTIWASFIKSAVEAGGAGKKAIVAMVGSKKTNIIDAIDDIPLHSVGILVDVAQREEENARFEQALMEQKQKGIISSADEYILRGVKNPKDRMALLAVREKQFMKRMEQERAQQYEQQQQLLSQRGEQEMNKMGAETDKELKKIYAKGEVEGRIEELKNQLGLRDNEFQAITKRALQRDRSDSQLNKALAVQREKKNLESQESLV